MVIKKVDKTLEEASTIIATFDLIGNGKSYKDIILGGSQIPGLPNNDTLVKMIQWQ